MAPLRHVPQHILDVGTGSGIWSIEIALKYPSAIVVGVDTVPVRSMDIPIDIPPNCKFEYHDVESRWTQKDDLFDLIHARDLLLAIGDWPQLVHQMYRKLRHGGWCELAAPYVAPYCTPIPSSQVLNFHNNLFVAAEKYGTPLDFSLHFESYLTRAGFRNVVKQILCHPCAPASSFTDSGGPKDCVPYPDAIGHRVFRKAFGWDQTRIELETAFLREALSARGQQYSIP